MAPPSRKPAKARSKPSAKAAGRGRAAASAKGRQSAAPVRTRARATVSRSQAKADGKATGRKPAPARPREHQGTDGLWNWITHTDLASRDPAATKAWCAKVLGWEFRDPMPMPGGDYHLFAYSRSGGGGIRATEAGEAPGGMPFVHVRSAADAFQRAVAAGAEPIQRPETIMPGVTLAVVRAPGGVPIGFSGP